jgi:chaperonin GroES
MSVEIKPIFDKIVAVKIEDSNVTKGGLYLPDAAKADPKFATAIAVGDGKILPDGTKVQMVVKPGDKFIFNGYCGINIEIADQKLFICSQDDVLAIVKE